MLFRSSAKLRGRVGAPALVMTETEEPSRPRRPQRPPPRPPKPEPVPTAILVPLLLAVQSVSAKRAAWLGVLSGFVFFMISLSWLHNLTGMVEGAGFKISALLGYVVLALYCALYFIPISMVAAVGARWWVGAHVQKNVRYMIALTTVWVGSEYLRSFLFTGFPWNPLGVSQYANTAIMGK